MWLAIFFAWQVTLETTVWRWWTTLNPLFDCWGEITWNGDVYSEERHGTHTHTPLIHKSIHVLDGILRLEPTFNKRMLSFDYYCEYQVQGSTRDWFKGSFSNVVSNYRKRVWILCNNWIVFITTQKHRNSSQLRTCRRNTLSSATASNIYSACEKRQHNTLRLSYQHWYVVQITSYSWTQFIVYSYFVVCTSNGCWLDWHAMTTVVWHLRDAIFVAMPSGGRTLADRTQTSNVARRKLCKHIIMHITRNVMVSFWTNTNVFVAL